MHPKRIAPLLSKLFGRHSDTAPISAELFERFPQQKEVLGKLSALLAQKKPAREYTLDRLQTLLGADDPEELAMLLGTVSVHTPRLKFVIRVVSPRGQGGIKDFDSLKDLPKVIKDWRQGGIEIPVSTDNIQCIFQIPGNI